MAQDADAGQLAEAPVEGSFWYAGEPVKRDPLRHVSYHVVNPKRDNLTLQETLVDVQDARPIRDQLDLDREGFKLVDHKTSATDFRDPAQLAQYAKEVIEFVRVLVGADAAFALGPAMPRFGEADKTGDEYFNARPARFVHADFTDESAHWHFQYSDGISPDDYGRFAIFNVWRAITPAPQDLPLAVCDASSVGLDDEVEAWAVMDPGGVPLSRQLTSVFRSNPQHKWFYFSNMNVDEALVFKNFDSDRSRANRVPHSAFLNPNCPKGVPTRASVEMRIVAMFDKIESGEAV